MGILSINSFHKAVAVAGTQEALSVSNIFVDWVEIKALLANTNNVYVGDSSVSSITGHELDAGETLKYESIPGAPADTINLADIFVDVDTNGEGVSVTYFQA